MKIAIVSNSIYSILVKDRGNRIGGAELQQLYIANGLRKKGHDVNIVTQAFGPFEPSGINGIKVYQTFNQTDGIPVLRYFYPRLYKIWKALKQVDADIYYTRTASFLTGVIALFCRRYKKKFIYAGAHDTDFIPGEIKISFARDRFLYKYGLTKASVIVVQSYHQKELLNKNFGLEGIVIPNFSDKPCKQVPQSSRKNILWVSTIRSWKQPLAFIDLAASFPDKNFIMIGGPDQYEKDLHKLVVERCKKVANIQYLGYQPLYRTEKFFDNCNVFINTSQHEGFPNTFLQAWRRGLPVISFVDPDNQIENNKLGRVAASLDEMKASLGAFLAGNQPESDGIMKYYEKHHSLKVIENYHQLFQAQLK